MWVTEPLTLSDAPQSLAGGVVAAVVEDSDIEGVGAGGAQLAGGGQAAAQAVRLHEGPQLGVYVFNLLPVAPARTNPTGKSRYNFHSNDNSAVLKIWAVKMRLGGRKGDCQKTQKEVIPSVGFGLRAAKLFLLGFRA